MSLTDWFILIFVLTGIVTYGIYKSRNSDKDSFLKGNQEGKWWTVCLGVMATQASGITFLSTPGQGYSDGLRFVQFYLGLPIAMLIICVTFIPIYFRSGVYTAYEYLEKRFDLKTRLLTSLLFLIQRGLGAGITLYAPAIILSALFGWNFKLIVLITGICVILYTVSGGAKAVSKTQTLQMTVMLLGLFFIFCVIIYELKGINFHQALQIAGWSGKMKAIDFRFDLTDRYNFWSGIIGGGFVALAYFGTDQSQVQRYLGGKSINVSRLGLIANGLFKVPMQLFILLTGVMVFVFYQLHSSPLFFNKPIEDRVLATSYASDYKEKQAVFDGILQSKQALTASLTSADFQSEDIKSRMVAFNEQELKVRNEAKEVIRQALPDAETNDRDYVFLHFVLNYLPVGLIGLLLAVVFSATMSSTSAELTALASTSTIDWFQRLNKNTLSGEQVIFYTRAFTLLWGIFAIAFAMYGSMFENLIQFVNLIGSLFYGTILGVFLCAFYLKYLHGSAVFIAAIISEIVVITLYNITDIGFLWFNLIGCGLVVSLASIWTAGRSLVKA
ncbi:MAG: sodium:solute symporter [Saprospiraceae bacterium]|jgi:Na+/proline symporter|nr:sodium:solute symporter [Saprospiraceae bacterium]MBK6478834.1 sodium:solute symporter [Saprospiraceae bacterium]MBK6816765.1 sodium:solute symporter [Saprospiraceae bacterium]MBK7436213.1 sodium:solute symporter [Saprospiraceae bacterium]MBK7608485.1 sodium:solute symporter [Saprospiraceae bacterium]